MSSWPQNGHLRLLAQAIRTRDNVQMLRVTTFISQLVRSLGSWLEEWLFGHLRPTPA